MNRAGQVHIDFRLHGMVCGNTDQLNNLKDKLDADTANFLQRWFSDSEKIKVMTSGSTGKPKEIELSKSHMTNSARATGKFFGLSSKTRALLCLPTKYIAGKMMLVRAMVLGWELDIAAPVSAPLRSLKCRYDFAAMVPLQLEKSIQDLYKIKTLIVGGAAVSASLIDKIKDLDTRVFATYGMTETITHIAVRPLNRKAILYVNEKNKFKKTGDFMLLPDVKISKDHRDCLIIEAKKITDEPIITNDLVEITGIDTFRLLGRIDHVINSGGIKLFPEVLEEKLSGFLEQPYFFTSLPDNELGEKLVLVLEGKSGIDKSELRPFLEKYELPGEIVLLKQFMYTGNNKIDRLQTRNTLLASRL